MFPSLLWREGRGREKAGVEKILVNTEIDLTEIKCPGRSSPPG